MCPSEIETKSGQPAYSGRILVEGFVEFVQDGRVVAKGRNHFTQNGLYLLVNFLSCGSISLTSGQGPAAPPSGGADRWFIVLGTDTASRTTFTTASLLNPIGTAPGTKPNSVTGSNSGLSNGASVTYTATWNAGTVSGTVGEAGLYLYFTSTSLQAFNNSITSYFSSDGGSVQPTWQFLVSRLDVADSDFTSFTINTGAPLTVNWTVQFTFS